MRHRARGLSGRGGQPCRRRKGQHSPSITPIVFCSKPFGILEPMKDVKAECDVIVVIFWKDYLTAIENHG